MTTATQATLADTLKVEAEPEAFYGLAGEIVRTINPYTEADPVAVLAHVLVAFGNVVGSRPHFRVEHTHHSVRLYAVLLGETAKGRKGTAWSTPRRIFGDVDPDWVNDRVTSGLSSGEGLIYAVRDPRVEHRPVREKGQVVRYEEVMADEGVGDKRLLVVEQEFSQALKVMAREGNILSVVIRQAWDAGDLHPLTKNNPLRATGAHISIIGHITKDELLRHLNDTEQANGFANRFIWFLVRRSKVIPRPTGTPEELLHPVIQRLSKAVAFATQVEELERDTEAEAAWADVYPDLSEGRPGLLGAILARGEVQVMRLACIYALLDCSSVIRVPHLKAALAVWDYSEDCARRIFGDHLGNPDADRILLAARVRGGLTLTEISNLFGGHKTTAEIDAALGLLLRLGLMCPDEQPTGGRPRTIWRPKGAAK